MFDAFWRAHRGALLLGLGGAVLLGSVLVAYILLVAGMSHCSACDPKPFLMRGFGLTLIIVALFGLAIGFGAAGMRWMLVDYLGRRATNAARVVLTLGLVALAAPLGVSAINHMEYRLEKAEQDALHAAAMDLCPDRAQHLAIIHEALPTPLPRETFVAEVRFPGTNVTPLYQGGEEAEVVRVIQGDPAIRRLIVERMPSDRCDEAFENGSEGLVIVIPHDRARGDALKVHPIFVRRGDGYRLPDGYQIADWERPYWLRPPPAVSAAAPRVKSETRAENGIAVTSVSPAETIVTPADPRTGEPIAQ